MGEDLPLALRLVCAIYAHINPSNPQTRMAASKLPTVPCANLWVVPMHRELA